MTDLNELLAHIPTDQIAAHLGIDPATAQTAIAHALPALLGGMSANAQDPSGAASLADAVTSHDPALIDGGVDLGQVDPADGAKIVGHVFGDNHEQVVNTLGGLSGGSVSSSIVSKVLPLIAPIVMSYLAKNLLSGSGGLGGLLGSLLGGGSGSAAAGSASASSSGPSLGGIDLGSILGGLGSLLGGGTR